jgi:AcrR family transcriptional regulator
MAREMDTQPVAVSDREMGTRARIQQVALELFTRNGYEATSLREIAEQVGVTKAALYYHFKTKDDIISSLVDDRIALMEILIGWAREQPRTVETKRELLRRYSDMLYEQGQSNLMRFFERNQSSMQQHKAGLAMRERMLDLLDLLADRDSPLTEQVRSSVAIFALHTTWFVIRDPEVTDEQRRAAALEVALSLVS